MKHLNSYNEGIFNSKKIDTEWLNGIKSDLEKISEITNVNLVNKSHKKNELDRWELKFKYKGQEFNFIFSLTLDGLGYSRQSDNKLKRLFKKTDIKISCGDWATYPKNYKEFGFNQLLQLIKSKNALRVRDESIKNRNADFKENLPENVLHDLLLNLEDILGESKISFSGYLKPTWEVSFPSNDILKSNNISFRNEKTNIASDKLFDIMNELSQLNSSLETFDCEMEFSTDGSLKLWITTVDQKTSIDK